MIRPRLEVSRVAIKHFEEHFAYAQQHYFAPPTKKII